MKKLLIYSLTIILLMTHATVFKTAAQTSPCGTSGTAKATGLVSTPTITGSFVTSSGACVVDPRAAFAPYKIPNYDELKSLYYDQSKAAKSVVTSLPSSFTTDGVYQVTGDLTVSNPSGSGNQIFFVGGNLNINQNYTYGNSQSGNSQSGTVFIVRGNVNIDPTVTGIDAIVISAGTIYTAGANCIKSSVTTSQLVINGSLISLTETAPAKFCRTLTDNSQPAEKINHQVKYLVLLRNLMSDTLQRWSEIP